MLLFVNLTAAICLVAPNFLGFNIDSGSINQDNIPHRLNFQDASLQAVVTRLAESYHKLELSDGLQEHATNAILRMGGSPADSLGFGANTDQPIKLDNKYWDSIADFAMKTHVGLSFDLNMRTRLLSDNGYCLP